MGGIYTLGPSEGTVVSGNVFHDIYSYSYGGWGLYTDEGSTGILFENNLVYNTKDGSFHQHYGKENIIRNNILVDSRERQVVITRAEPHQSISFERNIIVWKTGPALSGAWGNAKTVSGSNCWFNSAGAPIEFMGKSLADWQKAGHETGSIVADPLFVDVAAGDFRLKPGSPALALGFQPFDGSKAGVYGDAAWIAKARDVTYPPFELPPEIPPVAAHLTFERDEPGRPPRGFDISVGEQRRLDPRHGGDRRHRETQRQDHRRAGPPADLDAPARLSDPTRKGRRVERSSTSASRRPRWLTLSGATIARADTRRVPTSPSGRPDSAWSAGRRWSFREPVGPVRDRVRRRPGFGGHLVADGDGSRPIAAGLQGPRLCEPRFQDADLGRLHQQRGRGDVVLPGRLHAAGAAGLAIPGLKLDR
jgi:hypothetical protein